MPRTVREARGQGQVDLHGHHFSFHFADDRTPPEAGGPGALHCTVSLAESARLSKGRDAQGNDHYRPFSKQIDQAKTAKTGDLFRELLTEALADDEARAAAIAPAAGEDE